MDYLVVLDSLLFIRRVKAMLAAEFAEIAVNVGALFAIPTGTHEKIRTQFRCRLSNFEALASIGVHSFGIGFY